MSTLPSNQQNALWQQPQTGHAGFVHCGQFAAAALVDLDLVVKIQQHFVVLNFGFFVNAIPGWS